MDQDEMTAMAKELEMTAEQFKKDYCRRVSFKYSLRERKPSNDCIFLVNRPEGGKYCEVYNSRPLQCRTWPFWKTNLASKLSWQSAAEDCPGINKGRLFSIDEIEAVRDGDLSPLKNAVATEQKALQWIAANLQNEKIISQVNDIYTDISTFVDAASATCENCGNCCDFKTFGHRLYATTLEMMVFFHFARHSKGSGSLLTDDKCLYRDHAGCMLYEGRTAGCRIFYCRELPSELQNELYEQVLERLKVLHTHYEAPYYYADLMWWLKSADMMR